MPSKEFWGACQRGKEDRLDASSPCCRFVQHTKNRQANSGRCLVKIHFTEGLPAVICQEHPPHTYTQIPLWQNGSLIPVLSAFDDRSRAPSISRHLRHILYGKFYLNLVFRIQFQAIFYWHRSPVTVTPILAVYHFIFHRQFNTSHTWKWLCVFEMASFHHSLFLLPLKEGDPLKESICGNSKI